jgi:molybdenum cofactor cytidylyltransferase
MSGIAGILLAAGSSRRFGTDKRLIALADGTPMVLAAARNLAAICPRTRVVIRPDDMAVAGLLAEAGLETIVCESAIQGMGHSLACGVTATADASGWLIALADMPYIQPTSYRRVLDALQDDARIARPIHDGQPGHPVGFGADCFARLAALTGDQGGKAIIAAEPEAVRICPVDDPGVLHDIDHPTDAADPRY